MTLNWCRNPECLKTLKKPWQFLCDPCWKSLTSTQRNRLRPKKDAVLEARGGRGTSRREAIRWQRHKGLI